MAVKYDPFRAATEIREQIASHKRRLAFLFGAGTSMAVGLPGMPELTAQTPGKLTSGLRAIYKEISTDLGAGASVENILDRVRTYRELLGDSEEKAFGFLKGAGQARILDVGICKSIYDLVGIDPPGGLKPHRTFSQWIQAIHNSRDYPVEIYTTNYDLLLEKALEDCGVPFFDGFIGAVQPFFAPDAVEAEYGKHNEAICPPRYWTRLYKLHGSINWVLKKDEEKYKITRLCGSLIQPGEELMIFPSREKYTESRKLPFIAFQDRLRKFLYHGECLLVIIGYNFSDQHLNEIIFQGLQSNPRMAAIAIMYSDIQENLHRQGQAHRNLEIFGPHEACVGGILKSWGEVDTTKAMRENWVFWDREQNKFCLGDFNKFTEFLEEFVGFKNSNMDTTEPVLEEVVEIKPNPGEITDEN